MASSPNHSTHLLLPPDPPPPLASSTRALIPFTPIFLPPAAAAAAAAAAAPEKDAEKSLLEPPSSSSAAAAAAREHKKRSKNWSRSETLALIRLRRELAHRFAKSGRKSELWDEIADTLRHNHFLRDAQQCRDKWEKLMAGYKEVRDGLKHPDDNPYYDELHPLLCHRQPKRDSSSSHTHHVDLPPPPTLHTPPKTLAMDPQLPSLAVAPHPPRPPPGSNGLQPPPPPSSAPEPRHRHRHRRGMQKPLAKRSANLSYDDDEEEEDEYAGGDEEEVEVEEDEDDDDDEEEADEDDDDEEEEEEEEEDEEVRNRPWKKMRRAASKLGDMEAVQALLESIISRQQRFFEELLSDMERKEEAREQVRQKREEKWREEERAQRMKLTDAMRILTQEILGGPERQGLHHVVHHHHHQQQQQQQQQQQEEEEGEEDEEEKKPPPPPPATAATTTMASATAAAASTEAQPKRRSKNWKRTEVLQLIRLRGEMEEKFVSSSRRAALWNELSCSLASLGIKRDGKQCREKWDKLMAEYKEVIEGKKEKSDSSYFPELQAALMSGGGGGGGGGRPREAG